MIVTLSAPVRLPNGVTIDSVTVAMPHLDHFDRPMMPTEGLGWHTLVGFTGLPLGVAKRLPDADVDAIGDAVALVYAAHELLVSRSEPDFSSRAVLRASTLLGS